MAKFDLERLRARAIARAGSSQERIDLELKFISDLAKVIDWLDRKGMKVGTARHANAVYDPNTQTISINSRLAVEQQLYILLHECGHHLIGDRDRHERFGMGYNVYDTAESRTLVHRVDVVDEELEAWHRGRRLAGRLKIKIDKNAFDSARAAYMKTYMKWCLRVDGYNGKADADDDKEPTASQGSSK